MNVKRLAIRSAIWTVLAIGLGLLGVGYITTHPVLGVDSDARSEAIGEAAGGALVVGYLVIWVPALVARFGPKGAGQDGR